MEELQKSHDEELEKLKNDYEARLAQATQD